MNCKQGDLAVYVGGAEGVAKRNVGRLFRVLRPAEMGWGGSLWWVVAPVGTAYDLESRTFVTGEGEAADSHLRPIRDPGDDARDETLDWLPSPVKEHA